MHTCAEWYRLGSILGLHPSDLKRFDRDHSGRCEDCCRDIFTEWLEENIDNSNYSVDWNGLLELLEDCKFSALAEELRSILEISPT